MVAALKGTLNSPVVGKRVKAPLGHQKKLAPQSRMRRLIQKMKRIKRDYQRSLKPLEKLRGRFYLEFKASKDKNLRG